MSRTCLALGLTLSLGLRSLFCRLLYKYVHLDSLRHLLYAVNCRADYLVSISGGAVGGADGVDLR